MFSRLSSWKIKRKKAGCEGAQNHDHMRFNTCNNLHQVTRYVTIIPWAQVGYNHFISNKGKWNNCFSKFSNQVLPPIFISTILQSVWKENWAHYFPYDVKLGLLAHSQSFLANQKARNAIVGAENLLKRHNFKNVMLIFLTAIRSGHTLGMRRVL